MNADVREAAHEEEEQQPPPIGSLEAIVEEQAAAEGAARQARVHCCYPNADAPPHALQMSCLEQPQRRSLCHAQEHCRPRRCSFCFSWLVFCYVVPLYLFL